MIELRDDKESIAVNLSSPHDDEAKSMRDHKQETNIQREKERKEEKTYV